MLKFPTTCLFVEGPDCSGKTTFISEVHRHTQYRWHIQDRSQVSRHIFAEFYNRKIDNLDLDLHEEVFNLNNRFVILLPDFDVVKERFLERGDEIHKTVDDIKKVYKAFSDRREEFDRLPNFILSRASDTAKSASAISAIIDLTERCMLKEVSDQVLASVSANGGECYPMSFTLCDDGGFEEACASSMEYEPEKEYYAKIFSGVHRKIDNELAGENEYKRIEDESSRRFVYTEDTCISFIQISIRDSLMDFNVVIRSTNVLNTFPSDLKFLYYLASTCYNRFSTYCDTVRLRFNLNSAHIIKPLH